MLLDKYLPEYTYREYHEIEVACPKETAYAAARNIDFSASKTIKFLFAARGLPIRDLTLEGFCNQVKFTFLEEHPSEEFIIGFWAKTRVERVPDPERFASDNQSRRLKVVWNFKIIEKKDGQAVVSTETRVLCLARITRFFFGIYWPIIRPFSGLIRMKMLKMIKESAERSFYLAQ